MTCPTHAVAFVFAAIVVVGGPSERVGVAADSSAAMFSADQSGCYSGNYTNTSVLNLSHSGSRLLVVCLMSCPRVWWCSAARYTSATGVCDLASIQLCTSGHTPLTESFYRLASRSPSNPFALLYADVRSNEQTYKGCQDALSKGVTTSGIVCVDPDGTGCFPVWCNFTAGQGWLTIHRRFSGQLDFISKGWLDYENGFGNLSGEYWLGLARIAALTKTSVKLVVDLLGKNNNAYTATYDSFSVSSAMLDYSLQVSGYVAVAGGQNLNYLSTYNGSPFSAPDRNPIASSSNCASTRGAGWWSNCGAIKVNINGDYSSKSASCVFWEGPGDTQGCQLQYITLRILF